MLNRAISISACVGVSVCANFSFAYASGFLLLVATALAGVRSIKQEHGMRALARLAAASFFPALLLVGGLAGSALTRFPRDQLIWGTDSLLKSWEDIRDASFIELNPYLVNPLLAGFLDTFKHYVFGALAGVGIVYLVLLFVARRQLREVHAKSRLLFAGSLGLVLAFTISAHWVQFKLLKIPLPVSRTSIFFVPLSTAFVGAALSVAPCNRITRAVRAFGIAI